MSTIDSDAVESFKSDMQAARCLWGEKSRVNPMTELYKTLTQIRKDWFTPPLASDTKIKTVTLPAELELVRLYCTPSNVPVDTKTQKETQEGRRTISVIPNTFDTDVPSLETSLLAVALHFVDLAQKKSAWIDPQANMMFQYSSTNRMARSPWPSPDFTSTSRSFTLHPHEAAITSFVRLTSPPTHLSELSIEKTVGAALMESLRAKNCDVFSYVIVCMTARRYTALISLSHQQGSESRRSLYSHGGHSVPRYFCGPSFARQGK